MYMTVHEGRCVPINAEGNPVLRTKQDHPYSYDTFLVWRSGPNLEANRSLWSDRLYQWDAQKYNRCRNEVFGNHGQYWHEEPEKIEQFLRLYYDDPELRLIYIEESCNQASGFPVWHFAVKRSSLPENGDDEKAG